MGRRATLGLAALLAATVMTGAAAVAGLAHHATPVAAAPAAQMAPAASAPARVPGVVAPHHEREEVD